MKKNDQCLDLILLHLKISGFVNHNKVLSIYSKSSIAVACSRWDEPLGRTSLEACSRGCATVISNRGGLPETITHGIILKSLSYDSVYKSISYLIKNSKKRTELQKLSYKNFHHTHKSAVLEIDSYRQGLLSKTINYSNVVKKRLSIKILHITKRISQFVVLLTLAFSEKILKLTRPPRNTWSTTHVLV